MRTERMMSSYLWVKWIISLVDKSSQIESAMHYGTKSIETKWNQYDVASASCKQGKSTLWFSVGDKSHDLDCAWNLQPDIHAACVDHDMQLIHVENCISRRHKNEITSIKGLQSLWIGSVQLHCMHFMHFTHVGVANIKATTWTTTTATRIVISMSTYMRLLCIHESYVASNALQWFYNHTALLFTMLDWRKVNGNRYFVETWYFYKQNLNSCYEGREVWLYIFRNI